MRVCVCLHADGPCLLHSVSGELLRVFESSERPMLMQASAEGHCVIYYSSGHVCVYSINGNLLRDTHIEDNIRVRQTHTNFNNITQYAN